MCYYTNVREWIQSFVICEGFHTIKETASSKHVGESVELSDADLSNVVYAWTAKKVSEGWDAMLNYSREHRVFLLT